LLCKTYNSARALWAILIFLSITRLYILS
jgi:hypothetical protein